MTRQRGTSPDDRHPSARRRVWGFAAVAIGAIGVFSVVALYPLQSVQGENRRVRNDSTALTRISTYRTTVADWQVYLEPRFARFTLLPSSIDPVDLAIGTQLDTLVETTGSDAVIALRTLGTNTNGDAVAVARANTALLAAITQLAPLASGRPTAVILAGVAAERAAYQAVWATTEASMTHLQESTARDVQDSAGRLETSRRTALTTGAIAAILTFVAAGVIGRGARRREQLTRSTARRRAFETAMQHALEMSKDEPDVYRVLTEALGAVVPNLQVEMLVANSSRSHFHQTLTTGAVVSAASGQPPRLGCGVVSPLECPATRRGHTLVFPTSGALDACPHLKGRSTGPCSAVCVAISLAGKAVGVLHATGPDSVTPSESAVRALEITSRRAAERVAMLRAFEKSEAQARSDPLTGLWNRRSLENRVYDLHREGIPYALAYGDLDHFKSLNDEYGHEAGDQALRLFSRVLRDSIRPNDLAARYGGEEFVIVLPDCSLETATTVLDRLRERLALALANGRITAFTASFGLARSVDNDTFDDVVAAADRALLHAKTAGRNRVVHAEKDHPLSGLSPHTGT